MFAPVKERPARIVHPPWGMGRLSQVAQPMTQADGLAWRRASALVAGRDRDHLLQCSDGVKSNNSCGASIVLQQTSEPDATLNGAAALFGFIASAGHARRATLHSAGCDSSTRAPG